MTIAKVSVVDNPNAQSKEITFSQMQNGGFAVISWSNPKCFSYKGAIVQKTKCGKRVNVLNDGNFFMIHSPNIHANIHRVTPIEPGNRIIIDIE